MDSSAYNASLDTTSMGAQHRKARPTVEATSAGVVSSCGASSVAYAND